MIFNKKLLALVIAHFAFAQFVFAADGVEEEKAGSKTAVAAAQLAKRTVERVEKYVDLDSAADKGSSACKGCGQALIRVTRTAADLTLALLTSVDSRIGGKLSVARDRALVFAQAADTAVIKKIGGTRLENAYGCSKATIGGLYSSLHEAIYPKLA